MSIANLRVETTLLISHHKNAFHISHCSYLLLKSFFTKAVRMLNRVLTDSSLIVWGSTNFTASSGLCGVVKEH